MVRDQGELDLQNYAGRWVALIRNRVVGQGGTPEQALSSAKNHRHKEIPKVKYVIPTTPLNYHPIMKTLSRVIHPDNQVFLVGGAIRDTLIGKVVNDFDFVVMEDVFKIARNVANQLNGSYFVLDKNRETARVLIQDQAGENVILDFAKMRGGDLYSDLSMRDFTINALATNLHQPQEILDPLGGARDLLEGHLKPCSPSSIIDDPIRIIRAVRIAVDYTFRILPETRKLMQNETASLIEVSAERIRDELFRLLKGKKPHTSIHALDRIGALQFALPELTALKGIKQDPPHDKDAWEHSIDTLGAMEKILQVLRPNHDPDISSNLLLGLCVTQLQGHLGRITKHLEKSDVSNRPYRSLLLFAALYHDVGKSRNDIPSYLDEEYFDLHAQTGRSLVRQRANELKFSNSEIRRLRKIIEYHMHPALMTRENLDENPKLIYRFFQKTQSAGIDVCLLSLADIFAAYGHKLSQDRWLLQLKVVRDLLDAWWIQHEQLVNPPKVISGNDLISEFGLKPGFQLGNLLEMVREAQVTGEVKNRNDAITHIAEYLNRVDHSES